MSYIVGQQSHGCRPIDACWHIIVLLSKSDMIIYAYHISLLHMFVSDISCR